MTTEIQQNTLSPIAQAYFNMPDAPTKLSEQELEAALKKAMVAKQRGAGSLKYTLLGTCAILASITALLTTDFPDVTGPCALASSLFTAIFAKNIHFYAQAANDAAAMVSAKKEEPKAGAAETEKGNEKVDEKEAPKVTAPEAEKTGTALERLSTLFFRKAIQPALSSEMLMHALTKGIIAQQKIANSAHRFWFGGMVTTAFGVAASPLGVDVPEFAWPTLALGAAWSIGEIIYGRKAKKELAAAAHTVTAPKAPKPA